MKEQYRNGNIVLATHNSDNYVVYDETRSPVRYRHYTQMHQALAEVGRLCANEADAGIDNWVRRLEQVKNELKDLCLGA